MHEQQAEYFEAVFSPFFLAAFRKGFGCQTTLLRLLEDWKRALDNHVCVAAILMDLSKAFDCLPHDLLKAKLKAYGLSVGAVDLLDIYLSNRRQRVKLGPSTSNWESLFKGVPQGSILGPLIFNIFINDIFHVIKKGTLYNYADDNTLSFIHMSLTILKKKSYKVKVSYWYNGLQKIWWKPTLTSFRLFVLARQLMMPFPLFS